MVGSVYFHCRKGSDGDIKHSTGIYCWVIEALFLFRQVFAPVWSNTRIVSVYDQETTQSQLADKPVAPRGRAT